MPRWRRAHRPARAGAGADWPFEHALQDIAQEAGGMKRPNRTQVVVADAVAAQVLLLHRDGTSARAIARALGISRNTVRRLVAGHERRRHEGASALPSLPPPRASKLIAELLRQFPDITGQRVFEELRAKGYASGYTMVRERVQRERPRPPVISLPTPEYGPGEMAESDWSPYTIDFRTGRRKVHVFEYVLVYSRRKAYSIHAGEDVHALMEGHVQAFQRFGGVAAACKYDSQKAVVVGREGGQSIWNLRFVDFATYHEFTPPLCRLQHPNDKPRVERGFWEFERSYLNGRSFHDEADLAARLVGGPGPHGTRRPFGQDGRRARRGAGRSPHDARRCARRATRAAAECRPSRGVDLRLHAAAAGARQRRSPSNTVLTHALAGAPPKRCALRRTILRGAASALLLLPRPVALRLAGPVAMESASWIILSRDR
ncbi:IS21 family transposase [Nannocystis punicea]|uniref:IS21 family transposase n=1 Tax=Nannocystis punicea TaxID=2995304 RepID=A0ABY7H5H9_9BACT|nr:IS21 family transposase [Nannocystis poenicansa]WAS94529.1 IS21 family transposase [Nannocystis poenicansa]